MICVAESRIVQVGPTNLEMKFRLDDNGNFNILFGEININSHAMYNILYNQPLKSGRIALNEKTYGKSVSYKRRIYAFFGFSEDNVVYNNYDFTFQQSNFLTKNKDGKKNIVYEVYYESNCGNYKMVAVVNGRTSNIIKGKYEIDKIGEFTTFIIDKQGSVIEKVKEFYPMIFKDTGESKLFWEKKWRKINGKLNCVYYEGKIYLTAEINGSIYLQWARPLFKFYHANTKEIIICIILSVKRINTNHYKKYGYILIPQPVLQKIFRDLFRV